MHSRRAVVLVALCAVFAGCGGFAGDSVSSSPTPDPEHPWHGETLVVALEAPDGEYDRYIPLLRDSLDYWERNAGTHAFPVAFELRPNASDPDITAQVVDRIYECGNEDHTAGCTLQATDPDALPETVEFEIRRNLSKASTVDVMKHELGHILGLDHGDRPYGVMKAQFSGDLRDRPDATDRALPWNRSSLGVTVDAPNASDDRRAAIDEQVGHALAYYNDSAEGTVPENVTLGRTGGTAPIRVTVTGPGACESDRPLCVSLDGTDTDGDDTFERHTTVRITVSGVDDEAVGWYVARGLAVGFGVQSGALPSVLSNASAADRRSAWWR